MAITTSITDFDITGGPLQYITVPLANVCLHHILHHLNFPITYVRILLGSVRGSLLFLSSTPQQTHPFPLAPNDGSPIFWQEESRMWGLILYIPGSVIDRPRSTTELCSLITLVHPQHQWLHHNREFHHQVHGWHNCSGSHLQWWDYRSEADRLTACCVQNNFELLVDFREHPTTCQHLTFIGSPVSKAESFRFLGTTINSSLKQPNNITAIKAQQRLFTFYTKSGSSTSLNLQSWKDSTQL